MKRRKWWAIILTAALLLSMTACGGGDKKGETAPSAGGETKEKAEGHRERQLERRIAKKEWS